MARTIKEIHDGLLAKVANDAVLSNELNSTSDFAIYRLFLYIVAFGSWVVENLHDVFKADVNETIAAMKPHSLRWYAEKAKQFQYGYNLVPETDYYDNTGLTAAQIKESKIVAYAAVVEQARGLRIKVAKLVGGILVPLDANELVAFIAYMNAIKDAGVKLNITTAVADRLRIELIVRINPLVLKMDGSRNDGTDPAPVKSAQDNFLLNLPFNGVYSVQKNIDAIQKVDGVEDLQLVGVQTKYGNLNFTSVNISVVPDAGYLRNDAADFIVTYTTT
jgi:hypothetical protein